MKEFPITLKKILTVEELLKLLSEMPMKSEVWTEGCDCYGEAIDVALDSKDNTVLILRKRSIIHAD